MLLEWEYWNRTCITIVKGFLQIFTAALNPTTTHCTGEGGTKWNTSQHDTNTMYMKNTRKLIFYFVSDAMQVIIIINN